MKKLLIVILIVSLPLITYFQYKNYKKFHPPVHYDFELTDSIDMNYHDQALVDEYYSKAFEIGNFARSQWRNGVDVRYPDLENALEMTAAKHYNRLLSRTTHIERLLENSFELKNQGYSNEEIMKIERGIHPDKIKWINDFNKILNISFGEQSKHVWNVQKELISKGYEHTLDGLFGVDTQSAITRFQGDNNLYPSGLMNEETFDRLFLIAD